MTPIELGALALVLLAVVYHRRRLCDLVSTPDGKLSHTRLWSNVAYAVGTWMFIRANLAGTATVDIWLVYLGVIGGHTAASKWIASHYTAKGAPVDAAS